MLDRIHPVPASAPPAAARPLLWAVAAICWVAAVAAGLGALAAYKARPGARGAVATRWPSGIPLRLAADRPTLALVAHPQCSCTRATLAEFARLMARLHGSVQAYALFIQPKGVDKDWSRSALFEAAARIPGVVALWDHDGAIAEQLGATTSGHVYLYAADGRLRFSGGITPSRGHQGDTQAAASIVQAVRGVAPTSESTVLGCALRESVAQEKAVAR